MGKTVKYEIKYIVDGENGAEIEKVKRAQFRKTNPIEVANMVCCLGARRVVSITSVAKIEQAETDKWLAEQSGGFRIK